MNGSNQYAISYLYIGLMFGSPEQREQSALGLGDLIGLTSPAALSPFVIKITGPLIRIIGDRFPSQVKAAILQTLSYYLLNLSFFFFFPVI